MRRRPARSTLLPYPPLCRPTEWNDLPGNDTDATGDAILIDPDRQLMETAIQALLKNRDNRPVSIKE